MIQTVTLRTKILKSAFTLKIIIHFFLNNILNNIFCLQDRLSDICAKFQLKSRVTLLTTISSQFKLSQDDESQVVTMTVVSSQVTATSVKLRRWVPYQINDECQVETMTVVSSQVKTASVKLRRWVPYQINNECQVETISVVLRQVMATSVKWRRWVSCQVNSSTFLPYSL